LTAWHSYAGKRFNTIRSSGRCSSSAIANPFDYLTQLQRHADQLAASTQLWMPWNYRTAMT
jgi:hypothetical protein